MEAIVQIVVQGWWTMSDLIRRQDAIDAVVAEGRNVDSRYLESERIIHESDAVEAIAMLPSIQPQTTTITIGRTKGGVTMWYECDHCGEPIDFKDNYCRNCGRRLLKNE